MGRRVCGSGDAPRIRLAAFASGQCEVAPSAKPHASEPSRWQFTNLTWWRRGYCGGLHWRLKIKPTPLQLQERKVLVSGKVGGHLHRTMLQEVEACRIAQDIRDEGRADYKIRVWHLSSCFELLLSLTGKRTRSLFTNSPAVSEVKILYWPRENSRRPSLSLSGSIGFLGRTTQMRPTSTNTSRNGLARTFRLGIASQTWKFRSNIPT